MNTLARIHAATRSDTHSQEFRGGERARFKQYGRFRAVELPPCERVGASLSDALYARTSAQEFSANPISLGSLATTLAYGTGLRNSEHGSGKFHPSGGACYPIEAYVVVRSGTEELPEGVFHYNVPYHVLEKLPWARASAFTHVLRGPSDASHASILLFLTARWQSGNYHAYGSFGYRLTLLEAGHIMQNVLLVSAAFGFHIRPFAGYDEQTVVSQLKLDTSFEDVIYSAAIGC